MIEINIVEMIVLLKIRRLGESVGVGAMTKKPKDLIETKNKYRNTDHIQSLTRDIKRTASLMLSQRFPLTGMPLRNKYNCKIDLP